jgi:hypothetical protein
MTACRAALALLVGGCIAETTIDHSPLNTPGTNSLLTNGGFENGLTDWSVWYGEAAWSSSGQRSGSGCLAIGSDAGAEIQDVTARLQAGHTYHLSAYVEISSTAQVDNAAIGMYGTDSGSNTPLNSAATVTSDSSSYQRLSMDFMYPANLVETYAYGQIQPGTGAVAYFDDFLLLETSPSGTTIPPTSQIVDNTGNIWTVTAGAVSENGSPAGYSADVTLLLYYNDLIYQENSSNQWFSWNGIAWIDAGDPRL